MELNSNNLEYFSSDDILSEIDSYNDALISNPKKAQELRAQALNRIKDFSHSVFFVRPKDCDKMYAYINTFLRNSFERRFYSYRQAIVNLDSCNDYNGDYENSFFIYKQRLKNAYSKFASFLKGNYQKASRDKEIDAYFKAEKAASLNPLKLKYEILRYNFALILAPKKADKFRIKAIKTLQNFSSDKNKISTMFFPTMEQYAYTFGRIGDNKVSTEAKNTFSKLNAYDPYHRPSIFQNFGLCHLTSKLAYKIAKRRGNFNPITCENLEEYLSKKASQEKNKSAKINNHNYGKKFALASALALFVASGTDKQQKSTAPQDKSFDKTEIQTSPKKAVSSAKTFVAKTDDFKSAKINHADSVYKNYYDNTIEIHIGQKGRQELYAKINQMLTRNNFQLSASENLEHLALVMTISNEVQPYSKDNLLLQNCLNSKEKLSEDQIKQVIKISQEAGKRASNIKGTGSHSNFDKASKSLQKKHYKNLKELRDAKKKASNNR